MSRSVEREKELVSQYRELLLKEDPDWVESLYLSLPAGRRGRNYYFLKELSARYQLPVLIDSNACLILEGILDYNCLRQKSRKLMAKKVQETNLKRYGVKNPTVQLNNPSKKASLTKISKRGTNVILDRLQAFGYEPVGVLPVSPLRELSLNCRHVCGYEHVVHFNTRGYPEVCPKCHVGTHRSNIEEVIASWLEELGYDVLRSDRGIIAPYELDLVLPEKAIAVEFNGFFWHNSSLGYNGHPPKPREYHRIKSSLALSKGYKLYHFWEDSSESFIKTVLSNALGLNRKVYARKLSLHSGRTDEVKSFIDLYHYQHNSSLAQYYFYLKDGDTVMAALSMRDCCSYYNNERYCVRPGYQVVGGFSRLMKAFMRSLPPKNVVTFCDRDFTPDPNLSVYKRYGFVLERDSGVQLRYYLTKPIAHYTSGRVYPRQTFRKERLLKLVPGLDSSLTEKELTTQLGALQVYNSGNWKYVLYLV